VKRTPRPSPPSPPRIWLAADSIMLKKYGETTHAETTCVSLFQKLDPNCQVNVHSFLNFLHIFMAMRYNLIFFGGGGWGGAVVTMTSTLFWCRKPCSLADNVRKIRAKLWLLLPEQVSKERTVMAETTDLSEMLAHVC